MRQMRDRNMRPPFPQLTEHRLHSDQSSQVAKPAPRPTSLSHSWPDNSKMRFSHSHKEFHLFSYSLSNTPLKMVCGCPYGGVIKNIKKQLHTTILSLNGMLHELRLFSHSLSNTPLKMLCGCPCGGVIKTTTTTTTVTHNYPLTL